MPDQFGNPLPGEIQSSPSWLAATGLPFTGGVVADAAGAVGGAVANAAMAGGPGAPVAPPEPITPAAPVAPSAPQAQEPQFVSAPQAKQQDISALLAPVGEIGTGSSTTVSKTDLGKAGQDAAQARDQANQQTLSAVDQQQAIEQQRADMKAASLVERGKVASAADAQINQYTQQLQKDTAEGVAGIKQASDDFERAAAEISPNHFWQQQGTGAKIGNLISIALSGLGQVFSAKAGIQARNGAMDLINLAIDRDIDMQKTALQAKERGIRTKESLYSTIRQQGADNLTAMAATKAASLGKVDRDLEAQIATTDNAEAKARGEALRAKVQAAQAAELQRVAEATATRVQSTAGSRPVSGLEVAQMQAGAQAAQQDAERERLGLVKKDPSLMTKYGQARDAESFRELAKAGLQFDPAERALKVMEKLGKKAFLNQAEADAYRTAQTNYAGFIKGDFAQKLGQVTAADEKFLEPLVPTRDGYTVVVGTDDARFKQVKEDFETRKKALSGYTVRTQ